MQDLLLRGLNQNCFGRSRAKRAERLNGVGSRARSRAPGGFQGQRPGGGPRGRSPGSSWVFRVFKTQKRISSHNMSFIFETSFAAKSADNGGDIGPLRYKIMISMIRAHSFSSDRPILKYLFSYRSVDLALTSRNDLLVCRGVSEGDKRISPP